MQEVQFVLIFKQVKQLLEHPKHSPFEAYIEVGHDSKQILFPVVSFVSKNAFPSHSEQYSSPVHFKHKLWQERQILPSTDKSVYSLRSEDEVILLFDEGYVPRGHET